MEGKRSSMEEKVGLREDGNGKGLMKERREDGSGERVGWKRKRG